MFEPLRDCIIFTQIVLQMFCKNLEMTLLCEKEKGRQHLDKLIILDAEFFCTAKFPFFDS